MHLQLLSGVWEEVWGVPESMQGDPKQNLVLGAHRPLKGLLGARS